MLAFSDKYTSYKQLQNAFFTLEGHAQALAVMEPLLQKMGNPVQRIAPEQKALYHAAAATLSNQVVALLASGYEMLEACGFDTENARRASAALVRGNVENVIASGCVQALTGPIERGDLVTVEKHLQVIPAQGKEMYMALAREQIRLAKKKNPHRDYTDMECLLADEKRRRRKQMKNTVVTFKEAKAKGEKLTMLTAYDYSTAKLVDGAGINSILVGDSLGNVVLGYPDTISVTMEDMIHHCAAVSRGIKDTLLICDMPFMSYQASVYDAVVNAGRLMKEGRAHAVKLEGGVEMEETIRAIVNASIPVCGHIGLTPQSINAFGGFKVQGKGEAAAQKLLDDARAVERAGAFAVVLECVPAALAKRVTEEISIPTIGIGAGADCDGQVLVYQDMLGMFTDFKPKFVKHFANVGQIMTEAFKAYDAEVKAGEFPAAEHTYKIDDSIIEKLY